MPGTKLGMDIFIIEDKDFLITVDYTTNYFERDLLKDKTAEGVILKCKINFSRFGIPLEIIKGPQFTAGKFNKFFEEYNFNHETISPGNSKASGRAEAAVKIAKDMLIKSKRNEEDPYIVLLNITRRMNLLSPVEQLIGRKTRRILPHHNKDIYSKVQNDINNGADINQ